MVLPPHQCCRDSYWGPLTEVLSPPFFSFSVLGGGHSSQPPASRPQQRLVRLEVLAGLAVSSCLGPISGSRSHLSRESLLPLTQGPT